ncbi:facilitated trehalose transporter Tret1-like [Belonocnema kinseyi]|uniref:facilitated trehalose transporter Tret1-like n=1 Tax=Belonocnema kinseyi TaxID=2817044 RepID=UPI00143D1C4C|nr:facilitated trehalose transporter Tret1-like [Belonocnema kinseyi]
MKFKNSIEPNSLFRATSEINEDNKKTEVSDKSFEEKGSQFHQYVAGIFACFGVLGVSGYLIWPSPALPFLKSKDSPFPITEEEGAWIVSMYLIGDVIGSLLNPLIIDRIGRKYSTLVSVIVGLIGWIIINVANNYVHLYVARLLGGISQGSLYSSLIIYLAEIAENNVRGIFMNIIQLTENGGLFLITIIAPNVSYEVLNLTTLVAPIIFCVIFLFMPESPYYCFMKGQDEKAVKILTKLRGRTSPKFLEADIQKIKLAIEEDRKNSRSVFHDLVSKKEHGKGFVILVFVKLAHQLSGVSTVYSYAEQISIDSHSPLNPKYTALLLNIFQLVACFSGMWIIDRVKRRVLFLVTALLLTLSLVALGLFFFLQSYLKADVSSITWLPLASMIVYAVVFTVGVGPVSFVLIGELFPMSFKGAATAFGSAIGALFAFGGIMGYTFVNEYFGIYCSFWIYAIVCFFSSLVIFWITPETMGKTLEEIQGMQNPDLQKKLDALSEEKISEQTRV